MVDYAMRKREMAILRSIDARSCSLTSPKFSWEYDKELALGWIFTGSLTSPIFPNESYMKMPALEPNEFDIYRGIQPVHHVAPAVV